MLKEIQNKTQQNKDQKNIYNNVIKEFEQKQNLLEIQEKKIIELNDSIDSNIIEIGRCLNKIEYESLYRNARNAIFNSWDDYKKAGMDRINMPPSTMSDYRLIASAYDTYKPILDSLGFSPTGNSYKLLHLRSAIYKYGPRQEVFLKMMNSTVREFIKYSRFVEEKKPKNKEFKARFSGVDKEVQDLFQDYFDQLKKIYETEPNKTVLIEAVTEEEYKSLKKNLEELRNSN